MYVPVFLASGRVTICEFVSPQYELQVAAPAHCCDHTIQLRTGSKDIENAPSVLEPRFATAQAPSSEVNLWICDGFFVFMSKRSWQSHKDTASVRHHLYRHNDGATRRELQRLIIGYFNDRPDRAWRPCHVIKQNKLIWEVFCLALGLELHSMVEKSRAMVRATRVDDVFVMPCPQPKDSRRPLDLHVGSSDRANLLDDPEEKMAGPTARADAFIAHCVRLGENVNDFVER